jgi:carbon storage regulator CsrA
MLILNRNIGEALIIGHDVTVTVTNVKESQVRL